LALSAVGVSFGEAYYSVSKDKLQSAARLLFSLKMNEKVHIALRSGAINEMQALAPGTSRKENRFFCTIDFYFGDIAGVTNLRVRDKQSSHHSSPPTSRKTSSSVARSTAEGG
jgi:hypothetical protein